ncbi:MAG: hypothetical protein GOMPHAMPRED_004004 [Gomphillus americanus]|uniref:KOW domain-containing protein n=1 Tax=Gomphillus americanus TaxID=1940652 RepID=A0A8H3FRE0_9LECA|nr:MAG: hypothetical protein GOMPHAMPRED_004004 [Gomphillus americanus]
MAESIDVQSSKWRNVEVGRVVLFVRGKFAGKLAAIVEIIDHKRVLVDGPSKESADQVPRHSAPLSSVSLTAIVLKKLPLAIRRGPLTKVWEKEEVESKWKQTASAKSALRKQTRKNLTDFERFKVVRLRKQARFEVRKAHASIRKSAK